MNPGPLPLILPEGEWQILASTIGTIGEVAVRHPGVPIHVITGGRSIAVLPPALALRFADLAGEVAATMTAGAFGLRGLPPRVRIAGNIRTRRLHLGLSQIQLAERLGWTRQHFGAVERGERDLSPEELDWVAITLGIDLDQLRT